MKLNVPTAAKLLQFLSSLQRINRSIVENAFQNTRLERKMSVRIKTWVLNKCGHDEEMAGKRERAMYLPVFSIGLTAYTTKLTKKYALSKRRLKQKKAK